MSDLIDRQALLRQIDIDSEGEPGYYGDTWKFIDTIKRMPSAALGTNLASLGTDCISRQAAIDALSDLMIGATESGFIWIYRDDAYKALEQLPSAEPKIIYCKDCRKHNKKIGFDENFHTVWKEDACPLASWRGKAQGHEFDYQYCAYGERRTE